MIASGSPRSASTPVAVLVVTLAAVLAGCGGGEDEPAPRPDSGVVRVPASGQDQPAEPPADARAVALLAAAATARAEVADGEVFSVGLEPTGEWEVTVVTADGTEHDLLVSDDGGAVTGGPDADRDDDPEDLRELDRLLRAPVEHVAALRTASDVPEARRAAGGLSEVGLDDDHGTAVWEVTWSADTAEELTVVVDATSGKVLGTEGAH